METKNQNIESLVNKGVKEIVTLSTKQVKADIEKGEKYIGVLAFAAANVWVNIPTVCKKELISNIFANGYDTKSNKKGVILDTLYDNKLLVYCIEKRYPPEMKNELIGDLYPLLYLTAKIHEAIKTSTI